MATNIPLKVFDDGMPTFDDFSTLLMNCDYCKWREIADCLKVPEESVSTISENLATDEDRDKKAFLLILSRWREKAPVRIADRIANWRNFRKALVKFDDLVQGIEKVKEGWSEDVNADLCDCKKPLALRTKKDTNTLFKICPKPRKKQCKRNHFAMANRLLNPKVSNKAKGPPEHLRHFLLLKRNKELVNFVELAPYLQTQGLLGDDEYPDITERNGISPQQHFKIFVTEYLLGPGKNNIVQKFVAALRNAKDHKGHEDLLKRIKTEERIMKAIDEEDKRTNYSLRKRKHVVEDKGSEKKDGPSKKRKYAM